MEVGERRRETKQQMMSIKPPALSRLHSRPLSYLHLWHKRLLVPAPPSRPPLPSNIVAHPGPENQTLPLLLSRPSGFFSSVTTEGNSSAGDELFVSHYSGSLISLITDLLLLPPLSQFGTIWHRNSSPRSYPAPLRIIYLPRPS